MKNNILITIIVLFICGCSNNSDFNELNKAAYDGDLKKVRYLIDNGKDINTMGKNGERAIYSAIKMNHFDVVKYMLISGAKLENDFKYQDINDEIMELINSYTLQLLDVSSNQILSKIKSYKGKKAVILNIWALWCKPCVEEFPMIVGLDSVYNELEVLFVNTDFEDQKVEVKKFLKGHNIIGESYFKSEKDEAFITTLEESWNGTLPFTIAYSKTSGDVVDFWIGLEPENRFRFAIEKAINL